MTDMEWTLFPAWGWVAAGTAFAFAFIAWHTLAAGGGAPLRQRLAWLALRGAILALLLVILLNPHRVERSEFREPLDVAVILDDSASMGLQDTEDGPTRLDSLRELVPLIAKTAGEGVRLRWYRFGAETGTISDPSAIAGTDASSDIAKALETVLGDKRSRSLGSVILLSDGQTADGVAAENAAELYRRAGVPLHTHLLGTPDERPDISLNGLSAIQESIYSPRVTVSGILQAPGFAGETVNVNIYSGEELMHTAPVDLITESQQFQAIFETPVEGFQIFRIEVSPRPGERLEDNNSGVVGVEVRERKIRVLNMEGTPRQGHALENALETDPDIEVTSLFFPQNEFLGSGKIEAGKKVPFAFDVNGRKIYNVSHPVRGFPRTMEGLLAYDVVINSDIFKEAFTSDQLDMTVSLVEEHGGGFVMVGGHTAFGAGHYDETVIDKLMPVDVYGNAGVKQGGFRLSVPEEMFTHPVMAVGKDKADTERIWRDVFPGFVGLNAVNRAKPGAHVLAFNADSSNQFGPLVVFAVQRIGRGRTMAFTSDTTPGWGINFQRKFGTSPDPTLYYRRFWNQTVRWLAADRIARKNRELQIDVGSGLAVPGEPVDVRIPFPPGNPGAAVSLSMSLAEGEPEPVDLIRNEIRGVWQARVKMPSEGEWVFRARMARAGLDPLFIRALVNVVPDRRETASTAANTDLMSALANIGGGRTLGDDPAGWNLAVDSRGSRIIEFGSRSLWDRWWVIALLLALLTLEWGMRRGWLGRRSVTSSPP